MTQKVTHESPSCNIAFKKNSTEEYRFTVEHYHGHACADLRVFYRADDGEYRPTRKGIVISVENWPAFLQGIDTLGRQLEAQGLLPTNGAA